MIRSFRHKGLELYFRAGSKAGIEASHGKRIGLQLAMLDAANGPFDMNLPGCRLHALHGKLEGHWAVWIDKNWRLTFTFAGSDATAVDYLD